MCRTADDGKTTSKESILKSAQERNDERGSKVAFWANLAASDLHAADARYHRACIANFFTNQPSQSCTSEVCDEALDKLIALCYQIAHNFGIVWNYIA